MPRTKGRVAAGDHQTAAAGAEALRAGGNAIDAVCAAAFAAFVVEPPLCSPAGAGVLVAGTPHRGLRVLDFFAAMPGLGAEPSASLDFFDVTVDFGPTGQRFHVGRGSAAVPGALPGLLALHQAEGELPLPEVLAPAIAYARDGYELSSGIAYIVSILAPIVTHNPGVSAIFGARNGLPTAGTRLDNPALADFLEHFGADPRDALEGALKPALLGAFGPDAGGLLTRRDLDGYRPVWREPLWTDFAGARLATNPPPSSGGTLIAMGLRLADRIALRKLPWLGSAHALELGTLLTTLSDMRTDGYDAHIEDPAAASTLLGPAGMDRAGKVHDRRRVQRQLGGTTHISVCDERGGVASLTMSNGEGCGTVLEGLGIHVNNFLGEEDINPHGFHRLTAGRRMTTMMSPSVLMGPEGPDLVLGSGGSNRIRSAILQVLITRAVWGMDLPDAIAAPRLHVEGASLWYEAPGWSESARSALDDAWPGATRFEAANMFFGGVHAVSADTAAGDPRRGGSTATVD